MLPDQAEAAARAAARACSCLSQAQVEPWTGPVPADMDIRMLHHLPPPPVSSGAPDDARVGQWREAFRPALCYFRLGPGFMLVKDVRVPGHGSRILIDQEPLIAALRLCEQPIRPDSQDDVARSALDFLLAEGLLLRFGNWVTTAPYRMRRWPVPTTLGV
jgi:hypothetical protein